MSRIRRLSVRGIRNFGDDEESSIRFFRPLTLILGPNGTGKTTIIEALKFATTGEFPAGKGKTFVHDPVLSTTSTVRGVVKAEIIDSTGNIYVIARTMECTRTSSSNKFKTLDSTLSRINKSTKKVASTTNRCTDVDAELAVALGVSKPILNYVIFCHQEDLNWPLQDGQKLKDKFDEIFDSARYNKALENITKYCKELQDEVRIQKAEKDSLHVTITEVKDKEAKLNDHERRLKSTKEKIEEINKELEPLIQKKRKMEKLDSDYKALVAEEERKQAEYGISKQQVLRLKENIQEIFEGTMGELNAEIESYDDILISKNTEICEFEDRLKDVTKEESRITNMLADERVTVGALKQQIKDQERKIALRNKVLNETLSAWNLDTVDADISEIEVIALTKRLEGKLRELERNVEEKRVNREKEEKELQKEVDVLRTEHSRIESEKNLKEIEVLEAREEINKTRSEITQVNAAASKLNSIESRIQDAKRNVDELSTALDVDVVKKDIHDKIKSRDQIETTLNKIDEEIASLHKQTSLQAELELHKSTLASKEKEVQKLKDKREADIKILLDMKELPQVKLKNNLDTIQQKLINETKSIAQEIQTEERRLATLEATVSHNELELTKKRNEIELDKKKIASICDFKDFDEVLLLQSRKVKDLQDRRGMYAHQGAAYKEYMKQLKEQNPCCPLCHRDFSERENVEKLLREMEKEMENHPSRLKQCEADLKIQQEKYDKMLQLKPVVEKVIHLEDKELENLKDNLEKIKKKVMQARINITELEEKKADPENKLAKCKEIMGDILMWDRCIEEISKLKTTINDSQNRLSIAGVKSERTVEEAQAERERLKVSLKKIRCDIEALQTKMNTHNEKMHDAREAYNALHEEQLKLRSDVQKLKQLKEKQEALFEKEVALGKTVDELRDKLTAAEARLNAGIEKLEKQKKINWEKQEADRKLVTEGTRRLSELEKIQDEVDAFIYRKIPDALARSEMKVESYQKSINEFLNEKTDIEKAISKLKQDITRQEVRKRELTDNVLLRKTQETMQNLQQQCAALKEKIRAINHDQIVDDWQRIQSREEALLRQKNVAKGNQEELERAVAQYTQELRKDVYRQARKNYKKKCIELTVQEEVILNLKAYSKVLDTAMIEYHEERMATVNKIMKQMWKLVYTGSDTTSIEIRTEPTEGVGNSRRTYNYKLVQTKHGHEMDMKGRCSAGQKVLASIIIRLALAETFCKDCGIIALDEPTTNLDEENADSLANALATVVKLRAQHQKNFQLIVISHDEKFLFKLAELNNNKGFYELYRKKNGLTAIKHYPVEARDNFAIDPVKEEISSDEETSGHSSRSKDNQQTESNTSTSKQSEDSQRKKRYTWEDDDDERTEERPQKKRYVLNL